MKHTPEPWMLDSEHSGEPENGHYYYAHDANGKTIFDTLNSEVAVIETDCDDERINRWDEQGKNDVSRAVRCVNALAGVPDPAAFMKFVDELIAAIEEVPELNTSNYHHEDVCDSESAKSEVYVAWNRLRAARGQQTGG